MFNAPIKCAVAVIGIALAAASCSSDREKADSCAESLLSQAKQNFESGDYRQSLLLLDSIDHAYPKAIDSRKEVRMLRPQALERLSAKELSAIDSLQVANSIIGDSLNRLLEFVHNPVEGYYIARGTRGTDIRAVGGIHGRVSPDYHFYLIASCPVSTSMVAVGLEADGESVRSAVVAFDGERNTRNSACETITFTEAESAPLAEFIENHTTSPISIIFYGSGGKNHRMDLNPTQRDAIRTIYGLVSTANKDKLYRAEKERLQRQLEIARMQLANVSDK